jgi:hypothetical protein
MFLKAKEEYNESDPQSDEVGCGSPSEIGNVWSLFRGVRRGTRMILRRGVGGREYSSSPLALSRVIIDFYLFIFNFLILFLNRTEPQDERAPPLQARNRDQSLGESIEKGARPTPLLVVRTRSGVTMFGRSY